MFSFKKQKASFFFKIRLATHNEKSMSVVANSVTGQNIYLTKFILKYKGNKTEGARMVVQSSASVRTRWRECRSEFKTAFAYLFLFQLITIQLWGNTISDIEVMSIVWPRRYGQVLAWWVKETAIIRTQIKNIRGKYFTPTRIWTMV